MCHFLRQTHGINGHVITEKSVITQSFTRKGDFLTTNISRLAIGVVTADCLPLIVYDSRLHVISICHAGWRSSIACIALQAIEVMHRQFSSAIHDLDIFFGPAAKNCCYTVSDRLIEQASLATHPKTWLITKNQTSFFDLALYNRAILMDYGISPKKILNSTSKCII